MRIESLGEYEVTMHYLYYDTVESIGVIHNCAHIVLLHSIDKRKQRGHCVRRAIQVQGCAQGLECAYTYCIFLGDDHMIIYKTAALQGRMDLLQDVVFICDLLIEGPMHISAGDDSAAETVVSLSQLAWMVYFCGGDVMKKSEATALVKHTNVSALRYIRTI